MPRPLAAIRRQTDLRRNKVDAVVSRLGLGYSHFGESVPVFRRFGGRFEPKGLCWRRVEKGGLEPAVGDRLSKIARSGSPIHIFRLCYFSAFYPLGNFARIHPGQTPARSPSPPDAARLSAFTQERSVSPRLGFGAFQLAEKIKNISSILDR